MTILEARRKILNLQTKLTYNKIFKKARFYDIKISKRRTKNKIMTINRACSKIYTQQQNLQNKINYYLELLKNNPYKITVRDLAISRSLDLANREKEIIKREEEKEILKLESDYENLIKIINQYDFNIKKVTESADQLNQSTNPYKKIKNRIVDIRFDIKIIDIDVTQHSATKWAEIYHLKLYNLSGICLNNKQGKTSLQDRVYDTKGIMPTITAGHFNPSIAEQKELRAKLMYMDIINNATEEEKEKLKNKFIYTLFIQKQLNYLYD